MNMDSVTAYFGDRFPLPTAIVSSLFIFGQETDSEITFGKQTFSWSTSYLEILAYSWFSCKSYSKRKGKSDSMIFGDSVIRRFQKILPLTVIGSLARWCLY